VWMTDPSSTGSSVSLVVFDPKKLKSADENAGTFDKDSRKIRE
jgi:hypothetical protein